MFFSRRVELKKDLDEQEKLVQILTTNPDGLSVDMLKNMGLDSRNSLNVLLIKKKIEKCCSKNDPITKDTLIRLVHNDRR